MTTEDDPDDLATQLSQLDDAALLGTVNAALAARNAVSPEQRAADQEAAEQAALYSRYYPGSKR